MGAATTTPSFLPTSRMSSSSFTAILQSQISNAVKKVLADMDQSDQSDEFVAALFAQLFPGADVPTESKADSDSESTESKKGRKKGPMSEEAKAAMVAKRKATMEAKANEPKPFLTKLEEKIIMEVENDPWAIKEVAPAQTSTEAVDLVKEILGGTKIDKDIPHCSHGEREWRTGNKNGKAWANMSCSAKPMNGERWSEVNKCDPIWYVIDANGSWKPQEPRA